MERAGTLPKTSLPVAIFASCAAIAAAFVALSMVVLFLAGDIADRVRLEAEIQLVGNELDRQTDLLARDQAQISHWDDTVRALGERIDRGFVRKEIAEWLWEDFGIETTVVLAADGRPAVVVQQDRILEPQAGDRMAAAAADLARQARERYLQRRQATGAGFVVRGNPLSRQAPLFVADIRPVNGRIGFVVAQAIIPDHDAVLPDGAPQVLLTFKPLTAGLLATIRKTLGLAEFRIVAAAEARLDLASMPVGKSLDGSVMLAEWQIAAPSAAIWRLAAVPVLALLGLVACVLLFVARRSAAAVSALEDSERQNRFLALHDALTGLPNRLQFDRALEETISQGRSDRCAILCIDLDRFKAVNDTYGHHAGDAVIRTVAGRIAESVGSAGIAARIGGDEFIVLLHDQLDRDSVLWRCDQLIESICRPVGFEGGLADVGASIGVAWWPDDARTAKAVIRSADEALYRAKQLGRGRACCAEGSESGDIEAAPARKTEAA